MLINQVGKPAADFELPDTSGRLHRLSDFAGHWLLLVFHRHLAWLPCREHVSQLRQQEQEWQSRQVSVCIVTFEADFFAKAYVRESGLTWPLLVDSQRSLYAAYGMERAGWGKLLSPAALWAYGRLILSGRAVRRSTDDVHQMGGDVLIDPQGIVRLHFVSSDPADRPSAESILATVRPT